MTDTEWAMESISPAAVPARQERPSIWLPRSSDELLARHAARGSERAFAVLFERYHQPLYRYCRSIVRNEADAQDALQSTFAAALSALKRRQRNAPLRPWLFRIAHNEAIGVIRKRARDSTQELPEAAQQTSSSAEDEATDRARWAALVADLAELPDRARSALLLRELSGLSHQEIALALDTSVGGAKQAIFEARQALFELSEGRAMNCEEVRRRISGGDGRVLRARAVRAHLGDCAGCERFADTVRTRTNELRAFAPVLAPAASAAILGRALCGGAPQGSALASSSATVGSSAAGGSAASGSFTTSPVAAAAAGKAAAAAVASKVIAAAAVVATAGVGVAGVRALVAHQPTPRHAAGHSGAARSAVSSAPGAERTQPGSRAASARDAHRPGTHRSGHATGASGNLHTGRSAAVSRHRSGTSAAARGSAVVKRRALRSGSRSHTGTSTRSRGTSSARPSTPSQPHPRTLRASRPSPQRSSASSRPVHTPGSVSVAGVTVPLPKTGGQAVKVLGR